MRGRLPGLPPVPFVSACLYDERESQMRKFLLGTTALLSAAAVGVPASASMGERIELELRGYAQFGLAGIVSAPDNIPDDPLTVIDESEFTSGNSVVFGSDSEVHFRGRMTLDSGLAISFRAELELENDPEVDDDADIVDEVYVQVDGGFGRVQLGMQDGVADQMIISAPNVFAQFTISSIDMNPFEMYTSSDLAGPSRSRRILGVSGVSSYLDTSPDFSQDHTKVIYFTPRIWGLQVGASYAPNACRNDTGLDVNVKDESDPDPSASCGAERAFGSNYWEVAGNFEHEFEGFGVGLSASYGQGNENPFEASLSDKPSEWHAGGEFFFGLGGGRLTIGGAYKETDNLTAENIPGIFARSQHYDAGATFSIGPWEVGGAYGKAQTGLGTSDEELTLIIGGASFKLGPGVKLGLGVIHGDAREGAPAADFDKADATAVFSELDLRF